jgi:hypothetical protein
LLGIAATCRPEGGLFLAASLLLVDVPALLRSVRVHLGAATLGLIVVVGHAGGGDPCHLLHAYDRRCVAAGGCLHGPAALKAGLWSTDYNDPLIAVLVIVGMVAGLVNRGLRIGLGAAVGALIVVWPMCGTTYGGYTILHRLSAACFLQVVAAGVGAAWLTRLGPRNCASIGLLCRR